MLNGAIAQTQEWVEDYWHVRTELWPEQVCIDHDGSDLTKLFWYWQERAMLEGGVPSIANFRVSDAKTFAVDLTPEDPMRYVMQKHPAGVSGDWNEMRFAEYPTQIHARACAAEYLNCKFRKSPTFVHIHQKMRGVERQYIKLAVPVSDETGEVTRAVYAFQFVGFPVIDGQKSRPYLS